MYGRILQSLNIVNVYRGMSKLKLKINVKVPQLLCIVVSVALNGEFERFGGPPTWRLHTRLCNFVRHISTNISTSGERTHLKRGSQWG